MVKFNTDKRDALSGSGAKKGYIVLSIKEAQGTVSTIEEKNKIKRDYPFTIFTAHKKEKVFSWMTQDRIPKKVC